jgi:phosphatidylserine decarboxylase precursor
MCAHVPLFFLLFLFFFFFFFFCYRTDGLNSAEFEGSDGFSKTFDIVESGSTPEYRTFVGGSVYTYVSPATVSASSLDGVLETKVTSLNSTYGSDQSMTIVNRARNVWYITFDGYRPYTIVLAKISNTTSGINAYIECQPMLIGTGTMDCAVFSPTKWTNMTFTMAPTTTGTGRETMLQLRNMTGALQPDARRKFFSMVLINAPHSIRQLRAISTLVSDTDTRDNENSSVVPILWVLFVFLMLFILTYVAVLQAWCLPLFHPGKWANLFWLCIFSVIVLVFSLFIGLIAWLLIGTILGLYGFVLHIYYCCSEKRRRRPFDRASGRAVEMGSAANGGADRTQQKYHHFDEKRANREHACAKRPFAFGRMQKCLVITMLVLSVLFMGIFFILFFVGWNVDTYSVWDRQTGFVVEEYQPQLIARTVSAFYSIDGFANAVKLDWFLERATEFCGTHYTESLSLSERNEVIGGDFIEKYNVDMNIFVRKLATDYSTVNDWFIRHIDLSYRPLAVPGDESIIVSPADSRLIAFQQVPSDSRFWIKGNSFTLRRLIGEQGWDAAFEGGTLAIFRLAPQDYHRYHSPVSGVIQSQETIGGSLHSVNRDAMTSDNEAIYNQRISTVVATNSHGKVAFVPIGAACVGSVVMTAQSGNIARGDEFGYFQFGGSTIAVIFEPGRVTFDSDIAIRNQVGIEALVNVRSRVAIFD